MAIVRRLHRPSAGYDADHGDPCPRAAGRAAPLQTYARAGRSPYKITAALADIGEKLSHLTVHKFASGRRAAA
jgi:hypothetical protein